MSRDKLPDVGTPYEGEGGTVQDAYEFILQNFCEANRLWCRMQNQVGEWVRWARVLLVDDAAFLSSPPSPFENKTTTINKSEQKDKKRREKERQELRILVGTNLVRLSQLQVRRPNESVVLFFCCVVCG